MTAYNCFDKPAWRCEDSNKQVHSESAGLHQGGSGVRIRITS